MNHDRFASRVSEVHSTRLTAGGGGSLGLRYRCAVTSDCHHSGTAAAAAAAMTTTTRLMTRVIRRATFSFPARATVTCRRASGRQVAPLAAGRRTAAAGRARRAVCLIVIHWTGDERRADGADLPPVPVCLFRERYHRRRLIADAGRSSGSERWPPTNTAPIPGTPGAAAL